MDSMPRELTSSVELPYVALQREHRKSVIAVLPHSPSQRIHRSQALVHTHCRSRRSRSWSQSPRFGLHRWTDKLSPSRDVYDLSQPAASLSKFTDSHVPWCASGDQAHGFTRSTEAILLCRSEGQEGFVLLDMASAFPTAAYAISRLPSSNTFYFS